jgi:uncharacterized protein YcbK (DUF882 family)
VLIPAVPPASDELAPAKRWGVRRRDLLLPALRRLKLRNANTGETFDGPYRDEAGPIPEAMADLVVLLRDHHVNKIGPLDLAALDFLADVMAATGQGSALILSAYRTPETNAKLAKTTFGVAERSQHMYGRALDISFGKRLGDARNVARRTKRGSGFETLLTRKLGPAPAVASRMARLHALARRQYLNRH